MWTLALIVVVAVAAAAGGYAVGRRSQTRTRRVFLVGFLFGSVAGAPVRRRLMRRFLRWTEGRRFYTDAKSFGPQQLRALRQPTNTRTKLRLCAPDEPARL
ncbi:hypothetical protein QWI29_17590 [Mycolicibacterium neoaurum]|uniref:hypothetical protein n=1 Tax=Mycolicibacterium neoaurum TaxID=1795 RepID=UPI002671AB3A|nr:hypothetical protein [Mycolicibacterium neoaurum]MDO3401858.1 hypothetical protein [Mycolicibacterium neoaurum]